MKLIIFSPLSLYSPLARMNKQLTEVLNRQGHTVFVVNTEAENKRPLPEFVEPSEAQNGEEAFSHNEITHWTNTEEVTLFLNQADHIIYHIGDHYPLHKGALEWLIKSPGIVILHHSFLGNLFYAWAQDHGIEQGKLMIEKLYSAKISEEFFTYCTTPEFPSKLYLKAPMTEWIAQMAWGIIAHSGWDTQRMLDYTSGPMTIFPFPYYLKNPPFDLTTCQNVATPCPSDLKMTSSDFQAESMKFTYSEEFLQRSNEQHRTEHLMRSELDRVKTFSSTEYFNPLQNKKKRHTAFSLLTFGTIDLNKKIETVIQAIGRNYLLRKNITYRLVGKIESNYRQHLYLLAKQLKVKLSITGAVNDFQLHELIQHADAVCCLYSPSAYEASPSVIEAMLYGKPLLLINKGFYQTFPNHIVFKISPTKEIQDVQAALQSLYHNLPQRLHVGKAVAKWAENTFNIEQYAEKLIQFCTHLTTIHPILKASTYFFNKLNTWGATEQLIQASGILRPLNCFET